MASQTFWITAQQNVNSATRHVCGHGDAAEPASLGNDRSLASVLLGVQYLVGDAVLQQVSRQHFALFDADGADENWLPLFVAGLNVGNYSLELGFLRLVNEICLIKSNHLAVRRDRHDLQLVGVHQFGGLGLRGASHSGQLCIHAEIVLQRDRRKGLVLFLDAHALLGLDGLVNSLAPAAALQDAAGELIDDLDFAVLNDVVLVALVQHRGLESDLQLVHEVLLHLVIQVVDAQLLLNFFYAGLSRHYDALVLFYFEIDIASQRAHD